MAWTLSSVLLLIMALGAPLVLFWALLIRGFGAARSARCAPNGESREP